MKKLIFCYAAIKRIFLHVAFIILSCFLLREVRNSVDRRAEVQALCDSSRLSRHFNAGVCARAPVCLYPAPAEPLLALPLLFIPPLLTFQAFYLPAHCPLLFGRKCIFPRAGVPKRPSEPRFLWLQKWRRTERSERAWTR